MPAETQQQPPEEPLRLADLDLRTLQEGLEFGIVSGNEAIKALLDVLGPPPPIKELSGEERRNLYLSYDS